ncbi:hypothetical protein BaRGS_00018644 [Batillaria attramentaria]|uniref:Uncharacterized protein n=1 Tax=Batillaria attramentaria TaxID=370345 RepID=A0ABD0KTL7_9CAEN
MYSIPVVVVPNLKQKLVPKILPMWCLRALILCVERVEYPEVSHIQNQTTEDCTSTIRQFIPLNEDILPAFLETVLSAVSGATAENYETLAAARPQSTGHYTQLSTKKQDHQPVMRSEDNETLATSPSSPYYLTLTADNQMHDAARNETYEQVMARPPSDHYTALNTGKSPRTK